MTNAEYQRIEACVPSLRGFCLASRQADITNAARLARQAFLRSLPVHWRGALSWAEGADA